jgi:hypothetical protein
VIPTIFSWALSGDYSSDCDGSATALCAFQGFSESYVFEIYNHDLSLSIAPKELLFTSIWLVPVIFM